MPSTIRTRILAVLADRKPRTAREIAAESGISIGNVSAVISKMIAEVRKVGEVRTNRSKRPANVWMLATKGESHV